MRKNIILILSLAVVLVLLSFVGTAATVPGYKSSARTPHYYDKANIPIAHIEIVALYFVPKDRTGSAIADWKEALGAQLERLKAFHALQFRGTSSITYAFMPDAIIGQDTGSVYDAASSPGHTDPQSLAPITRELSARLFDPMGDLASYMKEHPVAPGTRRVYLIVYEGDSAAGSGEVALVSRAFLTDKAYAPYTATFIAHEFYHTLGIPDHYQSSSYVFQDAQQTQVALLESGDIMGRVRVPLDYTYLDRETLHHMGL